MATESLTQRVIARAREPIDASSVAAFRIVFGLLMLASTIRFIANGWISEYYEMPRHFFTYLGFEWVKPWPGIGMYLHFGAMTLCAAFVTLGLATRVATAAFGLLFAYAHLIDKTNYLNHYYLVICLCFVMTLLPHGGKWVPRWVVWALRAQIGIVYVFAGIAKLKVDWLVHAQPMSTWLSANTDVPLLGPLFEQRWVAFAFSYAGVAFDLCIVPLLLWRRSRPFAYIAVVAFHVVTARLFHLGIFPWIMMASSLIFLPPDWPRRLLRRRLPTTISSPPAPPRPWGRIAGALLAAHFALQIALPLRHHLYPGDVCWTEQGFRFAWHVMVMEKDGSVVLHVRDANTGRRWDVMPSQYLTRYQTKMMSPQPDMILQLAHIVADDFRRRGVRDPIVTVDAFASLNGHRRARLIDPTVDLAGESDGLGAASWILSRPTDDAPRIAGGPR